MKRFNFTPMNAISRLSVNLVIIFVFLLSTSLSSIAATFSGKVVDNEENLFRALL